MFTWQLALLFFISKRHLPCWAPVLTLLLRSAALVVNLIYIHEGHLLLISTTQHLVWSGCLKPWIVAILICLNESLLAAEPLCCSLLQDIRWILGLRFIHLTSLDIIPSDDCMWFVYYCNPPPKSWAWWCGYNNNNLEQERAESWLIGQIYKAMWT